MNSIAVLGPENTFSEIAARKFVERQADEISIEFFPTIKRVIDAVGHRCAYAIVPIENMIDGYVQQTLDLLLHGRLTIIDEILVPIEFAFVANARSIDRVHFCPVRGRRTMHRISGNGTRSAAHHHAEQHRVAAKSGGRRGIRCRHRS
jgi:prephenate dehydratase